MHVGDLPSARSHPYTETQKCRNRSQLVFRNHLKFSCPGANGEIQTLQEPKANCRWVHHLRLGVQPRVSEIPALCFPPFAMQMPSLRRGCTCSRCLFCVLSVLFAVHLRFIQLMLFTPQIAILCFVLCFPKQTFGIRIEIADLSILCSKSEYSQQMPRCNKSN